MVATPGVALLHVPPEVGSLSPVVPPTHMLIEPAIADGIGLTVNG